MSTADTLTYTIVTPPAHGTLSGTAPNLTYTPAANYNGPDSFTFKVNDGTVDSATATVSITVTPVNDAPVAIAQSVTTAEDTAKASPWPAPMPKADALTYTIVAQPAHGTLSGTAPNLTYTPAANYNGADSFTFKANDGTRRFGDCDGLDHGDAGQRRAGVHHQSDRRRRSQRRRRLHRPDPGRPSHRCRCR